MTGRTEGSLHAPLPRLLVVLVIGIAWSAMAVDSLARGRVGAVLSDDTMVQVQDFASHLTFTRAVWAGTIPADGEGSAYTAESHLVFMQDWVGSRQEHALPYGYSPTMLWVLGLLVLVPLPLAFVIWTAAGYGVTAVLILKSKVSPLGSAFFFLSPVAVASIALGQTAVHGTAALLFLALASLYGGRAPESLRAALPSAVVLWALTAKPPVALAAAAGLLSAGRYRAVLMAAALTLATAALVTPLLGTRWPSDYLTLLSSYDRVGAGPVFAWSLRPDMMSNLRAFLSVDLGLPDPLATRIANLGLLLSLGMVVVARWRAAVTVAIAWCFCVLAYLLFASHVSFTEELSLLVIPALLQAAAQRPAASVRHGIWGLAIAAILLSPAIGPAAGIRPAAPFFLKLGILTWLVWLAWQSARARPGSSDAGPVG